MWLAKARPARLHASANCGADAEVSGDACRTAGFTHQQRVNPRPRRRPECCSRFPIERSGSHGFVAAAATEGKPGSSAGESALTPIVSMGSASAQADDARRTGWRTLLPAERTKHGRGSSASCWRKPGVSRRSSRRWAHLLATGLEIGDVQKRPRLAGPRPAFVLRQVGLAASSTDPRRGRVAYRPGNGGCHRSTTSIVLDPDI